MRLGYAGRLIPILTILSFSVSVEAQQTAPAARGRRVGQAIQEFDKDGDGKLNQEERAAARRAYANQRTRGIPEADGPRLPDGVEARRDVEYARVDGRALLLDLYLPKMRSQPLPVVVWIHGGGWRAGSKERCRALPLSGQGFAVVSINYRLTDVAPFPAQIHDCKAAIRWIRAHAGEYHLDPAHIGAWGSSAGGHLVALLGTSGGVKELEGAIGGNLDQSSRVQAVCDFCGPSSFRPGDFGEDGPTTTAPALGLAERLLGGPLRENREKARLASPVEHVSRDDPPFLIVHGERDTLVPPKHGRLLADALKKAGVEVTLYVVPGVGHGVSTPEAMRMAADFFDRHLKSRPATGPGSAPTAN